MTHKKTDLDYTQELKRELDDLKSNIHQITDSFKGQVKDQVSKIPQAYHKGEEKVAEAVETHPLQSIGIAAAVGFVLGAIFTRK